MSTSHSADDGDDELLRHRRHQHSLALQAMASAVAAAAAAASSGFPPPFPPSFLPSCLAHVGALPPPPFPHTPPDASLRSPLDRPELPPPKKTLAPSASTATQATSDASDAATSLSKNDANQQQQSCGKKPKKASCHRYPLPEKPRQKRAVIQDMVRPLKQWLLRHRHNPYPTKAEKVELAAGSNMTLIQVSNWFANARRRLKNVVQDPRCSWSRRLRMYNQFVQGNAELLSIASDDSIWDSDDDDDHCEDGAGGRDGEDDEEVIDVVECSDGGGQRREVTADGKGGAGRSMLQRFLSDSCSFHMGLQVPSLPSQEETEGDQKRKQPAGAASRKRTGGEEDDHTAAKRARSEEAASSRVSPPVPSIAHPRPIHLLERPSAIPRGLLPPPPPSVLSLPPLLTAANDSHSLALSLPHIFPLANPLVPTATQPNFPAASQPLPSSLKLLSDV